MGGWRWGGRYARVLPHRTTTEASILSFFFFFDVHTLTLRFPLLLLSFFVEVFICLLHTAPILCCTRPRNVLANEAPAGLDTFSQGCSR